MNREVPGTFNHTEFAKLAGAIDSGGERLNRQMVEYLRRLEPKGLFRRRLKAEQASEPTQP